MLIKIIYIHYVPNLGGAAKSLGLLIKNLDKKRYLPQVLLTHPIIGDALEYFKKLDITVDHIPINLVWDLPWYSSNNLRSKAWKAFQVNKKLKVYFQKEKPDIIHINDFLPVSAGLTAYEMGIPVVWHCRSVLLYTRSFFDPGKKIIREINRCSNKIIAISETEARQFNDQKLKIIYNPLELDEINIKNTNVSETRKKFGIQNNEYVVLAPIPLTKNKGAWDFIRACAIAQETAKNIQFKFMIVGGIPSIGRRHSLYKRTGWFGPKPYLDKAFSIAEKSGFKDRLLITGFRNDIYEIMNMADLIVFPSHLRACGRQCFEAGAFRKPILVTMPDKDTKVVLDGITGLIIPEKRPDLLGQSIARLAINPEIGKNLGKYGFKHIVKSFQVKNHVKNVIDIYKEILNGN